MTNLDRLLVCSLVSVAFGVAVTGCGGSSNKGGSDMSAGADLSAASCTAANGGGPVSGAADNHCYDDGGGHFVTYDPTQCMVDAGDDSSGDGGSDFGATMYGTSGNDDDCKYFVSYTVAPVCENEGVSFDVTLKDAVTLAPITYTGTVRIEAFLSDTHPANTAATVSTMTAPGVYTIGPVAFDAAGQWTVRFHFFENCTDSPTSPHGHAAFYIQVP